MSSSGQLILKSDLGEFFREEVCEARSDLGIEFSDLIEFYLVNLLCDYTRPTPTQTLCDEPLALLYNRALEADLLEQIQMFKDLGDVSLYVAGFFTEFIERSLVDLDYYINMGGTAYGNLSSLLGSRRNGLQFADLYQQLGRKFRELVDVLNTIAGRTRDPSSGNRDLLRLYERWLRTGSERIRRQLVERGLISAKGLPKEYVH